MTRETNRREFIRNTAVGAASIWAGTQLGCASSMMAGAISGPIQFACIGVKGKGFSDSTHAAENGEVVAI